MAAHLELKFQRLNQWPDGLFAHVLWNGIVDSATGEGGPNLNENAAVDEVTPLTPSPIEVWPAGKAGDGVGPDGHGFDGLPQTHEPGWGDGAKLDGIGDDGLYSDYFTWRTDSVLATLRDGKYKFAVRFQDRYGNVQADPLRVVDVTVAGVPRSPRNLAFDVVNDPTPTITLTWDHSRDLIAIEV